MLYARTRKAGSKERAISSHVPTTNLTRRWDFPALFCLSCSLHRSSPFMLDPVELQELSLPVYLSQGFSPYHTEILLVIQMQVKARAGAERISPEYLLNTCLHNTIWNHFCSDFWTFSHRSLWPVYFRIFNEPKAYIPHENHNFNPIFCIDKIYFLIFDIPATMQSSESTRTVRPLLWYVY